MRRVIAVNTLSQIIGKILGSASTLLISFFIAQKFGASGYGDFIKVTTFVSFFFLVGDFGLNALFIQKQKSPTTFSTLLNTRIVWGCFLIFFAILLTNVLPSFQQRGYTEGVKLGIILFSPAIFLQILITSANALFQKNLRYDLATLAIAVGSFGSVITLFTLLTTDMPGALMGSITLLSGSLLTAIASIIFARRFTNLKIPLFSFKASMSFFLTGVPLGLTLIFSLVYGHIDSIVLTLTRSTQEVGIYGLAYKAFELILVIPTFFMNATYPLLALQEPHAMQPLLKKSFLILFALSLCCTLLTWATAPLLVWIQSDFTQSIVALRILALSLPFFFLSALTMWALVALKKQWLLTAIYAGAMIISIAANILFIPTFGYIAAAWTTVIGEAIVLGISGFFVIRYVSSI